MRALSINAETTMFTSAVPIPIIGVLPVNAYLIRGEQPTLIDAGITPGAGRVRCRREGDRSTWETSSGS